MSEQRPKVLISCYACNPYHGSEPGTGWNFVSRIASFCDIHVITEEMEEKADLLRYREAHPECFEHITLHFVRKVRHPLLRKIWPPIYYHFYDKWERKAYRLAIELDKKENFDLVHRLTLCSYRRPGYLWKLGKPFVWGPACGLSFTAWRLIPGLGWHGMIYFTFRNLLNSLQMRWGRAARTVAKRTDALLVADPGTLPYTERYWGKKGIAMREVGTEAQTEKRTPSVHEPGTPLRICWAGTLTTLKALNFVLRALPQCQSPMELHVFGRGNKEAEWKQLTKKLGLEKTVTFHGFIPHDDMAKMMASFHVLCFSSIKEGGTPTVVFEAMQNGLPVICIDHLAFASVVNEECGLKIPVQFPAGISRDFARHLDTLATDEELRSRLAHGALQQSDRYTWEKKMEQLQQVYTELIESGKVQV